MLVIRFNRFGKRNQAAFRVVLQEKTKAPGRRHIEMLGSYNPHTKAVTLEKERILHWIKEGAQPSDRAHNLLVKEGVIEGKIIPKKMPRPVKKEAEKPAETAAPATPTETPVVAPSPKPEEVPVSAKAE